MSLQNSTIKIGKINFINCLPFTLGLDIGDNEYQEGSPSELNLALREGLIDIAPISSFEFLKHKSLYKQFTNTCISSRQQAMSVLIFIRNYKSFRDNPLLYLSSQSASSANLSHIILNKNYQINSSFAQLDYNSPEIDNKLLIGDQALLENPSDYELVLDLGKEWFMLTGLPMVFAVWASSNHSNALLELDSQIHQNLQRNLNDNFPNLIIEAYQRTGICKSRLLEYFNSLEYHWTKQSAQSLDLFEEYLKEFNLL